MSRKPRRRRTRSKQSRTRRTRSAANATGSRRRRRRRGRGVAAAAVASRVAASRANGAATSRTTTAPEHAVTHEDHDGGSPEEDAARPTAAASGRRTRRRRNARRTASTPARSPRRPPQQATQWRGAVPFGRKRVRAGIASRRPSNSTAHRLSQRPGTTSAQPAEQPSGPRTGNRKLLCVSAQEPPRRRSTIREPAPFASETPPPARRTCFAAGSGDFQHRRRRNRDPQARLVGQASVGRQGLDLR